MNRRLFVLLGLSNFGQGIAISLIGDNIGILSPSDPLAGLDYLGLVLFLLDALVNVFVFYSIHSKRERDDNLIELVILGFFITTMFLRTNFVLFSIGKISEFDAIIYFGVLSPYLFGKLLEIQRKYDEVFLNKYPFFRILLYGLEYINKITSLVLLLVISDFGRNISSFLPDFYGGFLLTVIYVKAILLPYFSGGIFLLYGLNNTQYEKPPNLEESQPVEEGNEYTH